jgi:nitrogen regulatory protein PII
VAAVRGALRAQRVGPRAAVGAERITISEVKGHGRQQGHSELYRGSEYVVEYLPKIKIEVVVNDDFVEKAIEAITNGAKTGKIGDGKIFVSPILKLRRFTTLQFPKFI